MRAVFWAQSWQWFMARGDTAPKPTEPQVSPELLREADELTRIARTIEVWADLLRNPLYSRGVEPPETASPEERAAFEAWQEPAQEEHAAFVQQIRELLPPLRAAFAGPAWQWLVLQFCQIEGEELRDANKRGAPPTLHERLTTAARVLRGALAPVIQGEAAEKKEIERVERVDALIRAYAESSGGKGNETYGAVTTAQEELFGITADAIRKAEARRKAAK